MLATGHRCACGNLRRTTRIVTQYYDKFLRKSGLRSPQFSLLLNVSLQDNIAIGELGSKLLMDQTTVTRNIEILRKRGYVNVTKEDNDARRRVVSITKSGADKLVEALPLWEQAQVNIEQKLGSDKFREFLKTLKDIAQIVQ